MKVSAGKRKSTHVLQLRSPYGGELCSGKARGRGAGRGRSSIRSTAISAPPQRLQRRGKRPIWRRHTNRTRCVIKVVRGGVRPPRELRQGLQQLWQQRGKKIPSLSLCKHGATGRESHTLRRAEHKGGPNFPVFAL